MLRNDQMWIWAKKLVSNWYKKNNKLPKKIKVFLQNNFSAISSPLFYVWRPGLRGGIKRGGAMSTTDKCCQIPTKYSSFVIFDKKLFLTHLSGPSTPLMGSKSWCDPSSVIFTPPSFVYLLHFSHKNFVPLKRVRSALDLKGWPVFFTIFKRLLAGSVDL